MTADQLEQDVLGRLRWADWMSTSMTALDTAMLSCCSADY